jgi:Flp pilus assembly protein TadD/transglutaminase-like putative cysteine protease
VSSLRDLRALGLAVLFSSASFAQQTQNPTPATQARSNYAEEPFVIEQYHTRVRFETDGTGLRELLVRIRVESVAGVQQLGQLAFGYNSANERLEINSVEVRKADGSMTSVPRDAVEDMTAPVARDAPIYTDYRQKHVTVPALRPGETLSYHVTTRIHTPLAPGQFWFEHDFSRDAIVLDEQLEVDVPRNRTIKLKTWPGREPAIREQGDRRLYRWKQANLERENADDAKSKKKARKAGEAPAIQLTTFESWEEVGRWYEPLERQRATPSDPVRAKAQELVRGRSTDVEKIRALYDYVAKNVRYVSLSFGIGRYQPHAAGEVLRNQYGDCKDKHTLLESLVEAAGLRAYPVLISSARKMDPDVPSPAQFDHMITAIPLGQDWIWLDSTTEVAPFRMLSANLRHKQALLIPIEKAPVGPAGAARLMETPNDLPFPATQRVEVAGQLSELGKLTAGVRYLLRGDTELLLRLAFRRTAQNQWKQLGQWLSINDGFRGEVSEVKVSDPAATEEPFQIEYKIAQPNYLDWSSKKSQLALPLPAFGLPEASEESQDAESIELGTPLEISTRVELELPRKYAARAPVSVAVMRDYAEYRSTYKVDASRVLAERYLRFRLRELPAARASDYLAFARAVRADEGQAVAIESTMAGAPTIPDTAKTEELYEAGIAALRNGHISTAVELLERVAKSEPKRKHVWNELGTAYSLQGKLDKAVQAFEKQIELNPYDEQAHLLLGISLGQQGRYAEAARPLKQQLELNPLDLRARAALGSVYLEQRKYAEALPEFEKAVALAPNESAMHVGLGQAYLNLGRSEQALAEFDKAVELEPTPNVWNNVAYQLSLRSVHLGRAQQYAESAVAATAAALRNVVLERLNPNDLRLVSSLAAYWDTLGWVHFQKGELDPAEKYIRAAWLLDQHGEVGDHLAQIYEKRGRKQDALETYAQALASARRVPESRTRLALLAGGENKIEPLLRGATEKLSEQRAVKLGKLLKESADAEFFVLLSSAPDGAKVEDVRFVSGSDKLRPLGEALRSARYPVLFPDQAPTKVVRRGILSCSAATGECVFVLLLPDFVNSVN